MDVIIFILSFLATIFLLNIIFPPPNTLSKKCDIHEWFKDEFKVLRCIHCKKTPEQIIKDHENGQ